LLRRITLVAVLFGSILGSLSSQGDVTLAQEGAQALNRRRGAEAAGLTGTVGFVGLPLGGSHQGREAEALRLGALAEHALGAGLGDCDPLLIATTAGNTEVTRLTA